MTSSREDRGTLIRGGHVLTSGPAGAIADAAVRVVGDRIHAVGPWSELRSRFPRDAIRGGERDIVTPGFVNTHGHFSEGLITGIAERYTLWEWVDALIAPVAPHLDQEMAYVGTLLAGAQMLRTGITLANDMFVCDPPGDRPVTTGVVRALDELGLRGVVSLGAGDRRPTANLVTLVREHEALAEAASASQRCRFRVGVVSVGAQSPELLAESMRLAERATAGIHIHLQEIREEVTQARIELGVSPIEHCARTGMFEHPTIAAHCVWVDDQDQELLAAHDVGVAHNPVSNMILASGICPVPALRRRGIAVGIGVDGPASNDRQDMLEAIKTSVLLQRVRALQATALSAAEALTMATVEGARALGLDAELGSLEVGKAADLVVFDGDSAALANIHDPYQAVVYCAGPREVKEVMVAGQVVMDRGAVLGIDEAETVARSRPLARRLVDRAGLHRLSGLVRTPTAD
jgi:cytosine/adenosine deaminase-related metal-dependent hydrolase